MRNRMLALALISFLLASLASAQTMDTVTTFGNFVVSTNASNQNRITVSLTLFSFNVSSNARSIATASQSGELDLTALSSYYSGLAVPNATINVYFQGTDGSTQPICQGKTDANGNMSCSGAISAGQGGNIIANFSGNENLLPTTRSSYIYSGTTPNFGGLIDSSWLLIVFFLGLLAAGMYISGRRPMNAFDITTPRTKGPPKAKARGIDVHKQRPGPFAIDTVAGGVKGAVSSLSSVASTGINRMSMDLETNRLLSLVTTYANDPVKANEEVRNASAISDADKRAIMIGRMVHELGVHNEIEKRLMKSQSQLSKFYKRKAKIEHKVEEENAKKEGITKEGIANTEQRLEAINALISTAKKRVEEYERDLKLLGADKMMEMTHLRIIDPNKYEEALRAFERTTLIDYVELSDDPRAQSKDVFVDIREKIRNYVDKTFAGESLSLANDMETILLVKAEIERIKVVELTRALDTLRLAREQHIIPNSPDLAIVFDPYRVSEEERAKKIASLLKQINLKESKKYAEETKESSTEANKYAEEAEEFEAAFDMLLRSEKYLKDNENKFLSALRLFMKTRRSSNANEDVSYGLTRDRFAYNVIVSFSLLKKMAEGYLSDIKSGTPRYYRTKPSISMENARWLLDSKIVSMDKEDSFDILLGKYLRPSTGSEEAEFLKERLQTLEDSSRSVFNSTMEDLVKGPLESEQLEALKERLKLYEGPTELKRKLAAKYNELNLKARTEQNKEALKQLKTFIDEESSSGNA